MRPISGSHSRARNEQPGTDLHARLLLRGVDERDDALQDETLNGEGETREHCGSPLNYVLENE